MKEQSKSKANNEEHRYMLRSRGAPAVSPNLAAYKAHCARIARFLKEDTPAARSYHRPTPEALESRAKPKAIKALDFYNEKWAKDKDVSDAPVELFFAELCSTGPMKMSVELCVNMGPENPPSEDRMLHGCNWCYRFTIHHPATKGFSNGRRTVGKAATTTSS